MVSLSLVRLSSKFQTKKKSNTPKTTTHHERIIKKFQKNEMCGLVVWTNENFEFDFESTKKKTIQLKFYAQILNIIHQKSIDCGRFVVGAYVASLLNTDWGKLYTYLCLFKTNEMKKCEEATNKSIDDGHNSGHRRQRQTTRYVRMMMMIKLFIKTKEITRSKKKEKTHQHNYKKNASKNPDNRLMMDKQFRNVKLF